MSDDRQSLRELAQRVFTESPGDSLGLIYDPELALTIASAAAERYHESLDPMILREWDESIEGLEREDASRWPPELRAHLHTHRLAIDSLKKILARSNLAHVTGQMEIVVGEVVLASGRRFKRRSGRWRSVAPGPKSVSSRRSTPTEDWPIKRRA